VEILTASTAVVALAAVAGGLAYFRIRPQRAQLKSDGTQEASIVVRERYRPSVIVARCGVPLRLKFIRDEDNPCSQRVIFPDFGISRSLPAHRTTPVELVPQREGEFLFTCAMGMYQGTIVVTGQRRNALLRLRPDKGS